MITTTVLNDKKFNKSEFVLTLREEVSEEFGFESISEYEISTNTNVNLCFYNGEPEDNSLERNFSDVFRVKELVQEAYLAGKAGVPMHIQTSVCEED